MAKRLCVFLSVTCLLAGCNNTSSEANDSATEIRITALESELAAVKSDLATVRTTLKSIAGEDISWLVGKFWKKATSTGPGRVFHQYLTVMNGSVITFDRSGNKTTLGSTTYPVLLVDGKSIIRLLDEDGELTGKLTLSRTDQTSVTAEWSPSGSRQGASKATFIWVDKVTD